MASKTSLSTRPVDKLVDRHPAKCRRGPGNRPRAGLGQDLIKPVKPLRNMGMESFFGRRHEIAAEMLQPEDTAPGPVHNA